MNLKLSSIADLGDLRNERIALRVLRETNTGEYAILLTGVADGKAAIDVKSTFWFPDKVVQEGDLVVVYSKPGTQSQKTLANGNRAHFFYWSHSGSIWNTPGIGAVLLYAPSWESASATELASRRKSQSK